MVSISRQRGDEKEKTSCQKKKIADKSKKKEKIRLFASLKPDLMLRGPPNQNCANALE